jgi:hypothetical protein
MVVLAGIFLALGTVAFVLAPLVRHTAAPLNDGTDLAARLRELYALRDVTYETLRDLEFDFHAGKIAERDFTELSDRYRREALGLVARIEDLEAKLPGASRGGRGPA